MIEKPKRKRVDKQESGMPTNIEQLIEKYSLEDLWKYIEQSVDSANSDIGNIDNKKIEKESDVQDNIDANNCVKSGFYYLGSGCSNVPENYVRIITNGSSSSNSAIAQIAIGITSRRFYYRVKRSGTWSNWIELFTNIYSQTETQIGTWTNGKPLYRRVFTGTTNTSSAFTSVVSSTNFANREVIDFKGYVLKAGSARYPISSFTSSSGEYVFPYQLSSHQIQLYVSDYSSNTYDYVLIVEYIKTTD